MLLAKLLAAAVPLAQAGDAAPNPLLQFAPFAMIAAMAYFLFVVPQRAKQKRFQAMIDGLKENDHVVTAGGLHGVVTSVQREAEGGGRVTLRLDEATGAKARVSLWAIESVTSENADSKAD